MLRANLGSRFSPPNQSKSSGGRGDSPAIASAKADWLITSIAVGTPSAQPIAESVLLENDLALIQPDVGNTVAAHELPKRRAVRVPQCCHDIRAF